MHFLQYLSVHQGIYLHPDWSHTVIFNVAVSYALNVHSLQTLMLSNLAVRGVNVMKIVHRQVLNFWKLLRKKRADHCVLYLRHATQKLHLTHKSRSLLKAVLYCPCFGTAATIAISHHRKRPKLVDVKPACSRPDAMLIGIDVAQQAPEQAPTLTPDDATDSTLWLETKSAHPNTFE